jgi:hypothetical protein
MINLSLFFEVFGFGARCPMGNISFNQMPLVVFLIDQDKFLRFRIAGHDFARLHFNPYQTGSACFATGHG